jgi:hypothetical protein
MPSTVAAIRQASDTTLMLRTPCSTGRLQHNPDRSNGGLTEL